MRKMVMKVTRSKVVYLEHLQDLCLEIQHLAPFLVELNNLETYSAQVSRSLHHQICLVETVYLVIPQQLVVAYSEGKQPEDLYLAPMHQYLEVSQSLQIRKMKKVMINQMVMTILARVEIALLHIR